MIYLDLNIFQKRYCLGQRLKQNKLNLLQKQFSKYLTFCVRNVKIFSINLINHFMSSYMFLIMTIKKYF